MSPKKKSADSRSVPTKRPNSAKLILIHPLVATKWLEKNRHNRRIVKTHLERLKNIIVNDEYEVTGDTIKFDRDGHLLDGQHRLMACAETGIPIQSWVIFGLDPKVFPKIDQGAIRTNAHVLGIASDGRAGFKDPRTTAAAIKGIFGIQNAIESGTLPKNAQWHLNERLEASVAREFAREHEALLIEAVTSVRGPEARAVMRPPGAFAAVYFVLAQKNHSRAREFFTALGSGANLVATSPILKLRHVLVNSIGDKSRTGPWKTALTIRAWNAWLKKKPVRQLRFGDKDVFPKPRTRG